MFLIKMFDQKPRLTIPLSFLLTKYIDIVCQNFNIGSNSVVFSTELRRTPPTVSSGR